MKLGYLVVSVVVVVLGQGCKERDATDLFIDDVERDVKGWESKTVMAEGDVRELAQQRAELAKKAQAIGNKPMTAEQKARMEALMGRLQKAVQRLTSTVPKK